MPTSFGFPISWVISNLTYKNAFNALCTLYVVKVCAHENERTTTLEINHHKHVQHRQEIWLDRHDPRPDRIVCVISIQHSCLRRVLLVACFLCARGNNRKHTKTRIRRTGWLTLERCSWRSVLEYFCCSYYLGRH